MQSPLFNTAFPNESIPVLLLKTKSSPADSYEELFLSTRNGFSFTPHFLPVMQHQFTDTGIERLRSLLQQRQIGPEPGCGFGGIIFTSQRAVEAFASAVQEDVPKNISGWPHLHQIPIYSVGPATTRALRAIHQQPPLQIFGEDTGNGDALAEFIFEHYYEWYKGRTAALPRLLFLVGEQRRDVIPRILMDQSLPKHRTIEVVEEVVYRTGVMESFPVDLAAILSNTTSLSSRWIVVFSPMGCDNMLRGLGIIDTDTGKCVPSRRDGLTFVATIGPTTRNHLVSKFGFEPDVCADHPTPDGILKGIASFESKRNVTRI